MNIPGVLKKYISNYRSEVCVHCNHNKLRLAIIECPNVILYGVEQMNGSLVCISCKCEAASSKMVSAEQVINAPGFSAYFCHYNSQDFAHAISGCTSVAFLTYVQTHGLCDTKAVLQAQAAVTISRYSPWMVGLYFPASTAFSFMTFGATSFMSLAICVANIVFLSFINYKVSQFVAMPRFEEYAVRKRVRNLYIVCLLNIFFLFIVAVYMSMRRAADRKKRRQLSTVEKEAVDVPNIAKMMAGAFSVLSVTSGFAGFAVTKRLFRQLCELFKGIFELSSAAFSLLGVRVQKFHEVDIKSAFSSFPVFIDEPCTSCKKSLTDHKCYPDIRSMFDTYSAENTPDSYKCCVCDAPAHEHKCHAITESLEDGAPPKHTTTFIAPSNAIDTSSWSWKFLNTTPFRLALAVVTICLFSFLYYYVKYHRKKVAPNDLDGIDVSQYDASVKALILEAKRKHQQKRGVGNRSHAVTAQDILEDEDDKENSSSFSKSNINEEEMTSRKEKQMQLGLSLRNRFKDLQFTPAARSKSDFSSDKIDKVMTAADLGIVHTPSAKSGGNKYDPVKLMTYDYTMVRIGGYDAALTASSRTPQLIQKLVTLALTYDTTIHLFNGATHKWDRIVCKAESEKNSHLHDFLLSELSALSDVGIHITETEYLYLEKICEDGNMGKIKSAVQDISKRYMRATTNIKKEASLGKSPVELTKLSKCVDTLVNVDDSQKAIVFCVKLPAEARDNYGLTAPTVMLTCSHAIRDKFAMDSVAEHLHRGNASHNLLLTAITDDPGNDYALLRPLQHGDPLFSPSVHTELLPALPPYMEREYVGLAFLLVPNVDKVYCGKVWMNDVTLVHNIPTREGFSGAPIVTPNGQVLGIHQGTTGILNVGIPLDVVFRRLSLERFDDPVIPQAAYDPIPEMTSLVASLLIESDAAMAPLVPYRQIFSLRSITYRVLLEKIYYYPNLPFLAFDKAEVVSVLSRTSRNEVIQGIEDMLYNHQTQFGFYEDVTPFPACVYASLRREMINISDAVCFAYISHNASRIRSAVSHYTIDLHKIRALLANLSPYWYKFDPVSFSESPKVSFVPPHIPGLPYEISYHINTFLEPPAECTLLVVLLAIEAPSDGDVESLRVVNMKSSLHRSGAFCHVACGACINGLLQVIAASKAPTVNHAYEYEPIQTPADFRDFLTLITYKMSGCGTRTNPVLFYLENLLCSSLAIDEQHSNVVEGTLCVFANRRPDGTPHSGMVSLAYVYKTETRESVVLGAMSGVHPVFLLTEWVMSSIRRLVSPARYAQFKRYFLGLHHPWTSPAFCNANTLCYDLDYVGRTLTLSENHNKEMHAKNGNITFDFSYLPPSLQSNYDIASCEPYEMAEALGPRAPVVGHLNHYSKDYGKHKPFALYQTVAEDFGLPLEHDHSFATPTIESIRKDFAKNTTKIEKNVDYALYSHALSCHTSYVSSTVPTFRLLSHDEAISGMNLSASAGVIGVSTKREFVVKYEQSLSTFYDMVMRGDNPSALILAAGKEEIRDNERLSLGKIRSFHSVPIHIIYLQRRCLGDYLDQVASLPWQITRKFVGTSPYYGTWNNINREVFNKFEFSMTDMDIPKWDSKNWSRCSYDILQGKIQLLTTTGEQLAYQRFVDYSMDSILNPLCAVPHSKRLHQVVKCTDITASGLQTTFDLNCEINGVRHGYSVSSVYIRHRQELPSWKNIYYDTCPFSGGDDFNCGYFFNDDLELQCYRDASKDFGYEIPSFVKATKSDGITFMGCSSQKVGVYYVPVPNFGKIVANLYYMRKGNTISEYIQKLDSLVLLTSATHVKLCMSIIQYRTYLVRLYDDDYDVIKLVPNLTPFEKAFLLHFPVYENQVIQCNEAYPDKSSSSLQCKNPHNLSSVNPAFQTPNLTTLSSQFVRFAMSSTLSPATAVHPKSAKGKHPRKQKNKAVRKQVQRLRNPVKVPKASTQNNTKAANQIRNQIAKHSQVTKAIELSMALPAEYPAVRFNDGYDTSPTGVTVVEDNFDVSWADQSTPELESKYMLGFAFRDVERSSITICKKQTTTYDFWGVNPWNPGTTPSNQWSLNYNGSQTYPPNIDTNKWEVPLKMPYARYTNGTSPHGPLWLASTPEGEPTDARRFFWLDNGTAISVVATVGGTTPASLAWALQADIFDDSGLHLETVIDSTPQTGSGTSNINITRPGYYALSILCTTAGLSDTTTFVVTRAYYSIDEALVCGHRPAKDFETYFGLMGSTRVLATSLFYQNTSNQFEKAGEVYQVQVPKGEQWSSYLTNDVIKKINSHKGVRRGLASKGSYSYLKPTSSLVFKMSTHYKSENGVLLDSYYPFSNSTDTSDSFIVFCYVVDNLDARKGMWTITESIEYQSSSQFPELAISPVKNFEIYTEAVSNLAMVGQHFENPTHFKDIWKQIKNTAANVGNGILKYGPEVLSRAMKFAPLLL